MFIEVTVISDPTGEEIPRLINTEHIISVRKMGSKRYRVAPEYQVYVDKDQACTLCLTDGFIHCKESYEIMKDIIRGKIKSE